MAGLMDLFNTDDPAKKQALGMALLNFGSSMMNNSRGYNPSVGQAVGASLPGAMNTYQQGMNQAGMNKAMEAKDPQAMMTALGSIQDPTIQSTLLKYRIESAQKANEPLKLGAGETLYDPTTKAPIFTAPQKELWETVDSPEFGKGQVNKTTGEFKPVKTDVADPQKAETQRQAALSVVNRLLTNPEGVKANRGGISTFFTNVSDSSVNAEADLDTLASLLTVENLGLLKGVLSDTDMKILKDIGAGGLKGADDQVLNNLRTIQEKLSGMQTTAPNAGSNIINWSDLPE